MSGLVFEKKGPFEKALRAEGADLWTGSYIPVYHGISWYTMVHYNMLK